VGEPAASGLKVGPKKFSARRRRRRDKGKKKVGDGSTRDGRNGHQQNPGADVSRRAAARGYGKSRGRTKLSNTRRKSEELGMWYRQPREAKGLVEMTETLLRRKGGSPQGFGGKKKFSLCTRMFSRDDPEESVGGKVVARRKGQGEDPRRKPGVARRKETRGQSRVRTEKGLFQNERETGLKGPGGERKGKKYNHVIGLRTERKLRLGAAFYM